jgi:hypothetical protein
MSNPFFDHPILNSPYEISTRHAALRAAQLGVDLGISTADAIRRIMGRP